MQLRRRNVRAKGFTLLELAVAIALFSIFAGIAVKMGGATYQGAKSSRAVKELEALARAGILYSKKQNVSPTSLSDIGALYGKPIIKNIYNNTNSLSTANERIVTITTQIPAAIRPATTLSVIAGANLSSSAVMSYGMADEVRHERKRYFGN